MVTIRNLTVRSDDRGNLFEIIRSDDKDFIKFGQVYFVEDRQPYIIRAFHKHFKMWDFFAITHGSAKFVFFKDKTDKPEIVIANNRNPILISVPPGIWHGWMSLEPDTQMISIASEPYNRDNPDEERCDPYILGEEIWKIKAK